MTSTPTPETIECPDPSVAPLHRSAATRPHRGSVASIPNALASEWTKLRLVGMRRETHTASESLHRSGPW